MAFKFAFYYVPFHGKFSFQPHFLFIVLVSKSSLIFVSVLDLGLSHQRVLVTAF